MAVRKKFLENITDEHVKGMLSLIPQNAYRLLQDAILMYNHASYASAFALAVYSLEEVGKGFVLIAVLDPNENLDDKERSRLLNKALSDHASKQREALRFMSEAIEEVRTKGIFNSLLWGISNKYDDAKVSSIYTRALSAFNKVEVRKRRSIYVDLDGKYHATYPSIPRAEAFDAVDTCLDVLALLIMMVNNVEQNAWLHEIMKGGERPGFPPSLEEIIELSRLINTERFEEFFMETTKLKP